MTFCRLDENCAVFDRRLKLPGIVHRSTICEGCWNRIRSDLNLLRYDFIDLSNALLPTDGRSDTHIFRPKPESSPPVDMQALALRDVIVDLLTAAEDAVREFMSDRPRQSQVRDGYAVDQAVRYLSEGADALACVKAVEVPDGPVEGREVFVLVGRLHRSVRRCVGLLEPVVKLPGPCPRCGVVALRRRDDDTDRVWCQQCRTAMTKEQYYQACRMQFAPVTDEQPRRFT